MTVQNPPAWLTNAGATHTAAELRRMLRFATASSTGVRLSTDLAVTATGTPDMNVHVAAGDAVIAGTESALAQGYYHVFNDASVTLAIAASDPTNPRNDLIVFKVQDDEYSGGVHTSSLVVVQGTPAGSPADPAAPANSITLARVRVDALATTIVSGKITDLRTVAASPGGMPTGGYAQVIANQGGITAVADLTGLTVTVTLAAGRRIRVSGKCRLQQNTAGATPILSIQEGATVLHQETPTMVIAAAAMCQPSAILTPSVGAHTYKLTLSTGAGTVDLIASATQPAYILVEDLGST